MTLDVHTPETDPPRLDTTSLLAAWIERRLDATTDWFLDEARLYGVTVRDEAALAGDDDAAARYCLLDRGYPYDIVDGPAALLGANFDAFALLTLGWQAPIDGPCPSRPSKHPARERVRVVAVVVLDPHPGVPVLATAVRSRSTAAVMVTAEGDGRMADALRCLAADAAASRPSA